MINLGTNVTLIFIAATLFLKNIKKIFFIHYNRFIADYVTEFSPDKVQSIKNGAKKVFLLVNSKLRIRLLRFLLLVGMRNLVIFGVVEVSINFVFLPLYI